MRYFNLLILLTLSLLHGNEYSLKYWKQGLNFFDYLEKNHIDSKKFYTKINPDDIKFVSSIISGAPYFEDIKDGKLNSLLIPLGDEMQIYLHKEGKDYSFDIVPIEYKTIKDSVVIIIDTNCYSDLKKSTNNGSLATYINKVSNDTFDFKRLQKGDTVAIDYEQKSIGGLVWGKPQINGVYIQSHNKELFTILDGKEYKVYTNGVSTIQSQKVVNKKFLKFVRPLSKMKITSKFTYKRWHPILHRYRPHLGTDLRGKMGTPIKAIANGKVVFAGWIRGYGRVTKISHGGGLLSLYAHQSRQYVKSGQVVKAGQKIGAVGSTGRSTGPHLHLGVYKNHHPVNPMNYIGRKIAIGKSVSYRKIVKNVDNFEKNLTNREKRVYNGLKNLTTKSSKPYKWKSKTNKIEIVIKSKDRKNVSRDKLRNSQGAS